MYIHTYNIIAIILMFCFLVRRCFSGRNITHSPGTPMNSLHDCTSPHLPVQSVSCANNPLLIYPLVI